MLILLATFQFAEYRICTTTGTPFLLLGVWESIEKIETYKREVASKKALQWLIIGYLSFMGPMGTVYLLVPATRNAIASVMCGFAIVLAFILTFKVVPIYNRTHLRH